MTIQERIQEHVKEECKYCDIQECRGIYITQDNKTRCDKDERQVQL